MLHVTIEVGLISISMIRLPGFEALDSVWALHISDFVVDVSASHTRFQHHNSCLVACRTISESFDAINVAHLLIRS